MSDYSKRLVNEAVYGVDCLVLDDVTIQEFLEWRENLHEGSQVQGVYSDEGLYDFFAGFNDYKRVSKANEDFPEPERPVITIILFLGISRSTFFKLCVLAPFMKILSI